MIGQVVQLFGVVGSLVKQVFGEVDLPGYPGAPRGGYLGEQVFREVDSPSPPGTLRGGYLGETNIPRRRYPKGPGYSARGISW